MTFHYPYEQIVAMKEKEKEQAFSHFGASIVRKNEIAAQIQSLQEERSQWITKWEDSNHAVRAADIHQQTEYLTFLDQKITIVRNQLQTAEEDIRVKQEEYLEKRKDEKTWSHLREKSRIAYVTIQNKAEQNMLDELATTRYYYNRSSL